MTGIPGKSGPPGNRNAAGNSGGKPDRSGPPGNTNGATHGLTTYLRTGKLPKGCGWLAKKMRGFQQALEASVLEARQTVEITDAGLIQSACRHETIVQMLLAYLRRAEQGTGEVLKFDQKATALRMVGQHTDRRDACLRGLALKNHDANPWEVIHRSHPANGTSEVETVAHPDAQDVGLTEDSAQEST